MSIASARFNEVNRAQIVHAVIKHAYAEKAKAMMAESYAAFVSIYELRWSPYEVQAMNAAQSIFSDGAAFATTTFISVNAAGMSLKFGFPDRFNSSEVPVAALTNAADYPRLPVPDFARNGTINHSNRSVALDVDHPLCEPLQDLAMRMDALNKEIVAQRKAVLGTLNGFTNFRQLKEAWPEVWSIAEQFVPARAAESQLPAVQFEKLNLILDLPPAHPEMKEAA